MQTSKKQKLSENSISIFNSTNNSEPREHAGESPLHFSEIDENCLDLDFEYSDISGDEEEPSNFHTFIGYPGKMNSKRDISHDSSAEKDPKHVHFNSWSHETSTENSNNSHLQDQASTSKTGDNIFAQTYMKGIDKNLVLNRMIDELTAHEDEEVPATLPLLTDRMIIGQYGLIVKPKKYPEENFTRTSYDEVDIFIDKWMSSCEKEFDCKLDRELPAAIPFHGTFVVVCPDMMVRSCLMTLAEKDEIKIGGKSCVFSKFRINDFKRVLVVWASNTAIGFVRVKEIIQERMSDLQVNSWKVIGHEGKTTYNGKGIIADYAVSEQDYEVLRENMEGDSVRIKHSRFTISIMFADDRYPRMRITEHYCYKFANEIGATYNPDVEGATKSKEVQEDGNRETRTRGRGNYANYRARSAGP